ncbi:hypothetical protein F9288_12650 [Sphingomonas sp. CL5.1]|uniref:hypothetical protein n=1 Tax=Sphingomonas sp. CL5.1 TaxID=2653203 RepID=UPI001583F917|nr:hypothetical protein [Sphingomonas sp. CL5.1]QKS00379.1 hypothetical protein F9288_12650 [Sphingomonas sp. CL5.1]
MRLALLALLALAGCAQKPDPYAAVAPIIAKHCFACHASHPTHAGFDAPPVGVAFDSPADVRKHAARIKVLAVTTDVMPLSNETRMTRAEREALGRWIDAGAPIGE